MLKKINLVSFEETNEKWNLGEHFIINDSPKSVFDLLSKHVPNSAVDAWLFWDPSLGDIAIDNLESLLASNGDVYHAGLIQGMLGQPMFQKYVAPSWMLSCDPKQFDKRVVSWKLSLRCCLIRQAAFDNCGLPSPQFQSIEGASLELGYRFLTRGAILFHEPNLINNTNAYNKNIPLEDELLFVLDSYSPKWFYWAVFRSGAQNALAGFSALQKNEVIDKPWKNCLRPPNRTFSENQLRQFENSISVILPTRHRYGYLENCIRTLENQTIKPLEIICVDQNGEKDGRPEIYQNFSQVPIKVIWQNLKGQSTARNAAIKEARGEWLFFADDDSEYPENTIEQHIKSIVKNHADASTGLSLPPYEYDVPKEYRDSRIAYNLDTGNALIKRQSVIDAGGFDLTYNFGKGADTDLGMRLYLNGNLIIHSPEAFRIHYKAEKGGLREYGVLWEAKTIKLFDPKPAPTFLYFIKRFFPASFYIESLVHSLMFGGLPRSPKGITPINKYVRHYFFELVSLPLTLFRVIKSNNSAKKLLESGPRFIS